MAKRISQATARALRRRVRLFEDMARFSWLKEWPDDCVVVLCKAKDDALDASDLRILQSVRSLGHPVIAVPTSSGIDFFALKTPVTLVGADTNAKSRRRR